MKIKRLCCTISIFIIVCMFAGCGASNTPVTRAPSEWKACYYCGDKPPKIFYINGVYTCANCHNEKVFKNAEGE